MESSVFPVAFNEMQQRAIQHDRDLRTQEIETKRPSREGQIVRFSQVVDENTARSYMWVSIRFDDAPSEVLRGSYNRSFILGHLPEEVALLYGDDLIGLRCRVEYFGNAKNQGIAYISNPDGEGDLVQANTVAPFGTSLAPAGKTS